MNRYTCVVKTVLTNIVGVEANSADEARIIAEETFRNMMLEDCIYYDSDTTEVNCVRVNDKGAI